MINWKSMLEGALQKALIDGTDAALVAGAAAVADVIAKNLKGARGVRFTGLLFSEVYKRAGIERRAAIELIPL